MCDLSNNVNKDFLTLKESAASRQTLSAASRQTLSAASRQTLSAGAIFL